MQTLLSSYQFNSHAIDSYASAVLGSRPSAPPVSGLDMIYEEEGDSLYSGLDLPSYAGSDADSSTFGGGRSGFSNRSEPNGVRDRRDRRHLPVGLRRSHSLPGDEFRVLAEKLRELERTDSEVSGHTARYTWRS